MDFEGAWIHSDEEALDSTCLLEIPPGLIQTLSDGWGLGNAISTGTVAFHTLSCMEVPQQLYIDRVDGQTKAVTIGLVVDDPNDLVTPERRLQFDGKRYQVKSFLDPIQHDGLKRVLLAEISGGN